jgi:hypothetical protein
VAWLALPPQQLQLLEVRLEIKVIGHQHPERAFVQAVVRRVMHFAIRLGARTKFHRRLGHCALIAIWKISLRFLELDVGRDMLTLGVDSAVLADNLLRFGGGPALLGALHGSDGREQNRALMYFGHGRPFEFLNAVLTNAVHAVFEPLVEVEAHLLQR